MFGEVVDSFVLYTGLQPAKKSARRELEYAAGNYSRYFANTCANTPGVTTDGSQPDDGQAFH
jgi:hypothetical protein